MDVITTFEDFIAEHFEGSYLAFFITISAGLLGGWIMSQRRRHRRMQGDMRVSRTRFKEHFIIIIIIIIIILINGH